MTISLSGPVSKLVEAALNASVMRHDAIANNIANINTPGYKPLLVSFEDQLSSLMNRSLLQDDETLKARLETIKPVLYEASNSAGIGQLDIEMVNLTKNTIHYHALIKGRQDYGAIIKMAVKEGKS